MRKLIKYMRRIMRAFHRRHYAEHTRVEAGSDYITPSLIVAERTIYLDTVSWFWGNLSDGQAQYLLHETQDGTFIVRHDTDSKSLYSITYKLDGVVASVHVYEKDGELSINFDDPLQVRAPTLHGLITKLVRQSDCGGFACKLQRSCKVLSLKLNQPVNRMSSLRAHCKRVIRMTMPHRTINTLALPKHLKSFLVGSEY